MKSRGGCIPFADNVAPFFISSCRAIERILVRVQGWAKLGIAAAFMRQNEILNGIDECHRDLAACTDRFMVSRPKTRVGHSSCLFVFHQVALSMEKSESQEQEREMARQRDHQLLFDMVADLREEMLKRGRLNALEAPQSREKLSQVSLTWPYCADA